VDECRKDWQTWKPRVEVPASGAKMPAPIGAN